MINQKYLDSLYMEKMLAASTLAELQDKPFVAQRYEHAPIDRMDPDAKQEEVAKNWHDKLQISHHAMYNERVQLATERLQRAEASITNYINNHNG